MSRVIDTMTEVELSSKVEKLYFGSINNLRQELEKLFAPAPHWSDNLDPDDNQTWVLCFVSNASASCTWNTCWIYKVNSDGSYAPSTYEKGFLYATPVDLNLRYGNGEE